jgi:hypothetical protein
MFVSDVDGPSGRAAATAGQLALTSPLAGAVTDLLAIDPEVVSDHDLAEAMVALRRQQSRLAAAVSALTAAFDARRAWAEDGSRSAIDWIAVRARLPRVQVAGEVRDARRVRSMPATQAAWRAGAISSGHVRVLTGLAGHPRAGEHFAGGEALLVGEAGRVRFDDWQRLCAHWRDAADPDGPEQRRDRDQALRRFAIHPGVDGVGHADGYLTPLAAATVGEALARIERELFDADWAAAKQVHGDATSPAHLARTPAQRRHDALVEMAERAASAPAEGRRPAPLVNVMVDHATLAGRVCELASGAVVAPGDIAELLGRDDTLIRRVVFGSPNRITDISSARTFRGTLRQVLDLVHRRCDHETCFVPAARCQGDHVVPWSDGGPTTQANGRLGCGFHNRWWYAHRDQPPPGEADPPTGRAGRTDPDPVLPARHSVLPHPDAPVPDRGATSARPRHRLRRMRGHLAILDPPDLVHDDGTGTCRVIDLGPPPTSRERGSDAVPVP